MITSHTYHTQWLNYFQCNKEKYSEIVCDLIMAQDNFGRNRAASSFSSAEKSFQPLFGCL